MKNFALFDFDGTIAKGDSIISFLYYGWKNKQATTKHLFKAINGYIRYVFGKTSDTKAKEIAISFLEGKNKEEVQAFCQKWYDEKLSKKIFVQAAEEIEALKKKGHTILVITASPDAYMEPFKKAYGISEIIGTRVDLDEQGVYSGRISGNNCRGLEKNLRLAEYLAAKGWVLNTEESYGYGNSSHDEAMLHLVANPVLVNPSKNLKKAFPKGEIRIWKKQVGKTTKQNENYVN